MKLIEIMVTHIRFIDAGKSVYDAIEQMVDRRIRSLVVRFSDREGDSGVITTRDIVIKVLSKGLDPSSVKVAEIASRPLLCVDQDVEMVEAAAIMEENGVARVFVCDKGRLLGVVSMFDLMSAALIQQARKGHGS